MYGMHALQINNAHQIVADHHSRYLRAADRRRLRRLVSNESAFGRSNAPAAAPAQPEPVLSLVECADDAPTAPEPIRTVA